jgi:hypothetical protein
MKIVINVEFGGFGYDVAEKFEDFVYKYSDDRTNPELIQFVENQPEECGQLAVVEIPDNATDYMINEYDGLESVIYVVDGKIHIE